jgi:hypothetical protein
LRPSAWGDARVKVLTRESAALRDCGSPQLTSIEQAAETNVLRMERLKPGETKGSVLASMLGPTHAGGEPAADLFGFVVGEHAR